MLLGKNKPLGIITDYGRRVEVIQCQACAIKNVHITNNDKKEVPDLSLIITVILVSDARYTTCPQPYMYSS
jgi:hypothetical protein